ncbi:MAG: 3-isopropylmalate dehydratase small subunit [Gammaproteobacteria bacterium]|jgi:3-isopropylmalate/(R)-2-methylmalate dehydratase small subunit|nr:3-isopropylmalate dehydratase small subunit [Gammaproteobacteria bacterium]MCH2577393.1 3-isopropylmalate dehydratase small subunit [Pseudomonadales bacterium]MEC8950226.1 3-isopropylmalate dehydratase small subunit [Pseudomonadota bacterium]MED5530667.1 3-isopropylmalate dehydratase small subunit [Pseudomonadota bacterium]HBX99367.1 3-isopropylmalate dehydratase small subunit [Gammaproteobacteria bacterium]|tara:strand:- start:1766 stop:2404 length:639 start_codon:yes stop_codon:yes gene_type:complete
MRQFRIEKGIVLPLNRANVDTDFIIPKQFLKSIRRSGFGVNLFDEHRYLDRGEPDADNSQRSLNPDFVLNQSRYQGATILLARDNFGCGSSREHAPWALEDYGFRVLLAPSFADIFSNNCFKNGLLPIVLDREVINELFRVVEATVGYELEVDLSEQSIKQPDGSLIAFEVDEFQKRCLLDGLDEIGLTLEDAEVINVFEANRRKQAPWIFN